MGMMGGGGPPMMHWWGRRRKPDTGQANSGLTGDPALEQPSLPEGPKDLRESARKLMVNLFQLLPSDSELAAEYRRKLSAALY